MGRRRGLSTTLVLGAIVLLIAIAVGNSMGNRVLGQVGRRLPNFSTTPLPVTTPSDEPLEGRANSARFKRRQVLSVATDPAFPDPRITPEPTPPPTPQPSPRTGEGPAGTATAYPRRQHDLPPPTDTPEPERSLPSTYTSPPMLIPMPRRGSEEPATPAASAAPAPGASRAAVVGPTTTP